MVKDLKESRETLNKIDDKMKELYLERMEVIKDVTAYKIKNGMATFDRAREEAMKERLASDLSEPLKSYYLEFLETILKTSKDLQDKIKGE